MTTYADLRHRPRLDEAVAGYERMQARIRAALDDELGPFDWHRVRGATGSTGGHDVPAEFGTRTLALAPWGFAAPIPDPGWERARRIVHGIAREHGFTTPAVDVDRPGHHLTGALDPVLGASCTLGSQRTTIMQVVTGSHLPTGA
ncbi:LppA family lipoprotein [Pseudonocardia humida]|uniref:LppA-like lipoprotein n=1 Tax=Pseudonocardia humida TaxID=2800819 RepID=A0ABT0ZSV8_9PSEU|nr:LppA family lipoprotein [Pseudonocardia humida]MCO1653806.1 hypothetical protein [Pseudonocardia humida]